MRDNEFMIRAKFLHDLRSPLNGVLGVLELIQMQDKSGDFQELLEMAVQSCLDLDAIIGQEGDRMASRSPLASGV